jgi:hypothetical protein
VCVCESIGEPSMLWTVEICVRTQWNKVRKDNGKEFFPTRLYEEV